MGWVLRFMLMAGVLWVGCAVWMMWMAGCALHCSGRVAQDGAPIENLLEAAPGVLSGAEPRGDADFDQLRALGVRTIISVDGAAPDVARAQARGMRTIHLPIQYAGIDEERRAQLAAALRACARPIYVHCHHGLHRGPAAAAFGLVANGELSAQAGEALLHRAGTSPNYPGLYACVAQAAHWEPAHEVAVEMLPAVTPVGDMSQAMARVDRHWHNLGLTRDAGWRAPMDHPDLAPASEAGAIHDIFRALVMDETFGATFGTAFERAATLSMDLERAILAQERALIEERYRALHQACIECHAQHRDGALFER